MLRRWLVAALAAASVLAGCSRPTALEPSRTLVFVQTQAITNLDPARSNGGVAQELGALLHRYLLTLGPQGELVPDAALRVPSRANGEISRDGLTITYQLRRGLHFSDGRPLDAKDVVATILAQGSPKSFAMSRIGADVVRRAWSPKPFVVRVRLKRPFAPILYYLCAPGSATPILPARDVAALLDRSAPSIPVVGAGPYRVLDFSPGDGLDLVPNPWYSPTPVIARIFIRTIPSSNTVRVALQTHEADGYLNGDPALATLRDSTSMRMLSVGLDGLGALILNTSSGPLRDVRVRRAIARGLAVRRDVSAAFDHTVDSRNAGRGLFLWAYDPQAYRVPRYAVAHAKADLDAAGWHVGPGGVRIRNGRELQLLLIIRNDQPSSQTLAAEFAQDLRTIGIRVRIRAYALGLIGDPKGPLYQGRFNLALVQYVSGVDPDLIDQFGCDRIAPHGYNKSRYCNPVLDRLLRRASMLYSRASRAALYRKAQRILAQDMPLVPLYRLTVVDDVPRSLRGFRPSLVSPFYDVAGWRYSPLVPR